jgi:hypothetical protein
MIARTLYVYIGGEVFQFGTDTTWVLESYHYDLESGFLTVNAKNINGGGRVSTKNTVFKFHGAQFVVTSREE